MDYKKAFDTMVEHGMDYIKNNNLKSVVLGISGGIDSTIVACIFNEVSVRLKKEGKEFEFIGISMPTDTTDKKEFEISQMVLEAFCDYAITMDITSEAACMYGAINAHIFPPIFSSDTTSKYRRGNIKSRLRMIHLYDIAKAHGGIVLGTDNYTEYLLGYSTIGGDALFDYNPIQYLWKTEIYGLAEYLLYKYKKNRIVKCYPNSGHDKASALEASIKIPPQAGLGISTTDLEEIGAPSYEILDDILKYLVGVNKECHQDKDLIKVIEKRVNGNAYKRHLPILIPRESFSD